MKKLIMVLGVVVCLASSASATSLHFIGPSYTISDANRDGFSEQLQLGKGLISLAEPKTDALFSDPDFETVVFSDFSFDAASFSSGKYYNFSQKTYVDGMKIYDNDQSLLFDADITLDSLIVDQSTGVMNPSFALNLSNITASANYIAGTSELVDMFVAAGVGAANFSLQFPASSLGMKIEQGETFSSTYSGSAAVIPTPEPNTLLLLGVGLLGIYGIGRKKR